jgi:hypothetical protein
LISTLPGESPFAMISCRSTLAQTLPPRLPKRRRPPMASHGSEARYLRRIGDGHKRIRKRIRSVDRIPYAGCGTLMPTASLLGVPNVKTPTIRITRSTKETVKFRKGLWRGPFPPLAALARLGLSQSFKHRLDWDCRKAQKNYEKRHDIPFKPAYVRLGAAVR